MAGKHEHVAIWVASTSMPGYLVLRCACGETFGTTPLGERRR